MLNCIYLLTLIHDNLEFPSSLQAGFAGWYTEGMKVIIVLAHEGSLPTFEQVKLSLACPIFISSNFFFTIKELYLV